MTEPGGTATVPAPVGVHQPVYDRFYFAHDCGIPYERNDHWLGFFGAMADRIVAAHRPRTVLDAGCAMGILVECLRTRGVEAWGIDVSGYAIGQVHESVAPYVAVATLADGVPPSMPDRFDLVTCVEVIEHIPVQQEHRVLEVLTGSTDRLYLSSSPLDYGEPTHLNVRPPEYWARQLAELGFHRDVAAPPLLPAAPWGGVFERREVGGSTVVADYERELWRSRHEIHDLRATVLRLQGAAAAAEAQAGAPVEAPVEAPDSEVVQALREQVLNLRDAVIGAEAELGEHRGALFATQQELARYQDAARQLEDVLVSRTFRAGHLALMPARAIRRLRHLA